MKTTLFLIASALFASGLVIGRQTAPRTIGDCNAELEARYWRAKCYEASELLMRFMFSTVREDLGLGPYTVLDFLEMERENPEGLRTRHLVEGTQHPLVVAPNLPQK